MPASKLTAAGCPLFLGTVFKDYLETEFKMFLRREGIARVLDPAKDPRKLYVLPELPQSIPEAPAAVSARTPVGRATRSGAEEQGSMRSCCFRWRRVGLVLACAALAHVSRALSQSVLLVRRAFR